MSGLVGNPFLLASAAGGGGYEISRSLRFNSSDSAYLSRTPASAGNRKTWTVSAWCKRSVLGTQQGIFEAGTGAGTDTWAGILFGSNNTLTGGFGLPGAGTYVTSSAVFRDTAAWYHVVCAVDTTNATSTDRVKLWVNNSRITAFSDQTYDAQNTDSIMNTTNLHVIGQRRNSSTAYFSGYLADIHFCDGYAYDPSYFTEFDDNGILQPIAFTGSYGTNGFHLPFSDNSTAAALGTDSSGAGNTWTVNNISVTAGAGNDSLVDVPTNGAQTDTGVGGEVRGNYCTLNPLTSLGGTYSQGNLRFVGPSAYRRSNGTVAVSTGKWYWEVTLANDPYLPRSNTTQWNAFGFGVSSVSQSTTSLGSVTDAVILNDSGYYKNFSGSVTDVGTAFSSGDVLSCAVDLDANTFTFRRNNTQVATGTIGGTAGRELAPIIISYDSQYGVMDCNFGQRPFAYTAPSGFKALNTANMPAPVITKPSEAMDVLPYTGTGSNPRTLSGLILSPGFVWIKDRSAGNWHRLNDTVRGPNKTLFSNDTAAELANDANGYLSAFTSDGFTVTNGSTSADGVNKLNNAYVAWCWDAGSSTVTNTQGSISSQVRANASAGFSVVTWTQASAGANTIGHGLGVAPSLVIVKSRSLASEWAVYHAELGATKFLKLNATDAAGTVSAYWNNTAPTSSVFSVGSWSNLAGDNLAYCFAPVAGYSSFGSYTGNGSADGPFVYTGFRPRWILWKCTTAAYDWDVYDAVRDPYNAAAARLKPNSSDAEATLSPATFDILSNGFKLRQGYNSSNASGQIYIYFAVAESPFQYARAR